MNETTKTATHLGVALTLVVLAWVAAPRTGTPGALQDRGKPFFPELTDPNAATSLEVVEFDETSEPRPFKVLNRNGRWTIPTRYDYPADGGTRLSQIAAAVIALKKDDVASENVADEERCGVLDPLDSTLPTQKGRGTRITVKGQNEKILADIIVGKPIEGRPYLRYVRVPGQKRTYVSNVGDLNVSTKFEDWIERDLLQVTRDEIDEIVIRNYSFDVRTGDQATRETLVLRKKARDEWTVDGMRPNEQIDTFKMNLLVTKLDELTIADVLRKPPGITATLTAARPGAKLEPEDVRDLASKGFYFTREGQLLSNEGDALIHTTSGIFYTLRFGEVVGGAGGSVQASSAATDRYLFISVGFDSNVTHGAPPAEEVARRLALLRARFASWYYVISGDSFKKIRLERNELVKPKVAPAGEHAKESTGGG
jgi:hypothetical protein